MSPESLQTDAAPPADAGPLVLALWHAHRGAWDVAHELVQALEGADAAWIHAHLHRQEGDEANAGYWYRRAGRPHCRTSIEEEWMQIARVLAA